MKVLIEKDFKDLKQLLENTANICTTGSDYSYYYLPYCFIKTTQGQLIMEHISSTPEELKRLLEIK